jgi:hypothetical protein
VGVVGEIFRVKITLKDCKPTIWREIEVASSMSLAGLHDVLQVLMGWENYHLWAFEAGQRRFELPDPDGMDLSNNPPEDCGGTGGYRELLAARKKPKSARGRELLEWAGPDWDPEAFDLAAVNKERAALPAPRRLH